VENLAEIASQPLSDAFVLGKNMGGWGRGVGGGGGGGNRGRVCGRRRLEESRKKKTKKKKKKNNAGRLWGGLPNTVREGPGSRI